jgi:hypothetical protein
LTSLEEWAFNNVKPKSWSKCNSTWVISKIFLIHHILSFLILKQPMIQLTDKYCINTFCISKYSQYNSYRFSKLYMVISGFAWEARRSVLREFFRDYHPLPTYSKFTVVCTCINSKTLNSELQFCKFIKS